MAVWNLSYYHGEDHYSDGDVENTILHYVRNKTDVFSMGSLPYSVLYHLANVRENILNWYPFRANATVLEVGAGCGAITGLLCHQLKHVTAVELSKRRADILFERHGDCDHLAVCVGNLNDMSFPDLFDYIVVNGVLEHAAQFTAGDQPYHSFLQRLSSLLKKDGKLLLAIENRYGIKYFAGAPEDHASEYYLGLNDYSGNDQIRTFTKSELQKLTEAAGLPYTRFYYPYPDYKFPYEVFTDDSLKKMQYGKNEFTFSDGTRTLFSLRSVCAGLCEDGIMDHFANSFLLEASPVPLSADHVWYAKMNNDRGERFRMLTKIVQQANALSVVKEPLTAEARTHLSTSIDHAAAIHTAKAYYVAGTLHGDQVEYPYLQEETLESQIQVCLEHGQIDQAKSLLSQFFVVALAKTEMQQHASGGFQTVFGPTPFPGELECVCPANIDLIPSNVFITQDTYQIIDNEWIFDFPVPKQFIIWRCINDLYSYTDMATKVDIDTVFALFGIDDGLRNVFRVWEEHFALQYVNTNYIKRYQARHAVDNAPTIASKVYFGRNDAPFSEDCVAYIHWSKNGALDTTIQSSDTDLTRLRLDPVEGDCCIICSMHAEVNGCPVEIHPYNGVQVADYDIFMDADPQYHMDIPVHTDELTIRFWAKNIYLANETATPAFTSIVRRIMLLQAQREALIAAQDVWEHEHACWQTERDELICERNQVTAQRDALVTEKDSLSEQRDALKLERDQLSARRDTLMLEHDHLTAERDALRHAYLSVLTSTSWKITAPIRWAARRLKSLIRRERLEL